ncbi:hypothetical protein JCM11251_001104 [Rhodosporidiobolus azoricus]
MSKVSSRSGSMDVAQGDRPGCHSKKLRPIDTQSSGSGSTKSTTSSTSPRSSKFSFSALHDAVARGHNSHKNDAPAAPPDEYTLAVPTDPVHLVETAISLVLSVPGPPLDQLRSKLIPKLYHSAYSHRVNCREHEIEELIRLAKRFRERFQTVRIRFRSHLMDLDGTATIHAAAVGIQYDIIAQPFPSAGQSKHDVHELRGAAMGVHKIYEGRLAQTDLVVDTSEFQLDHQGPQLACVVM